MDTTNSIANATHNGASATANASASTEAQSTAAVETHASANSEAVAKETASPNVFTQLLTKMGDHHEIDLQPITSIPLPYIFWDQDGFHHFSGEKEVEESQTYTIDEHGKALRKDGKPIKLDMSITANVCFMALAATLLVIVLGRAATKAKKSLVPSGFGNLVEILIVFIRDDVVYPNVEQPWADRLMPFFLSVFFFIMCANLFGLLPWGHSATSALGVTAGLAIITFVITQFVGLKTMGVGHYFKHFTGGLLEMDLPVGMKIALMIIMVPIEIMGLFTKPFALTVRLFANMTGGHIMILALIGLAFKFQSYVVGGIMSVPFSLFIDLLEIFVALLQAYIFTALSAVFIGFMAHNEHEEHVHDKDLPHAPDGNHLIATSHAV